jgi:hypothetical protein
MTTLCAIAGVAIKRKPELRCAETVNVRSSLWKARENQTTISLHAQTELSSPQQQQPSKRWDDRVPKFCQPVTLTEVCRARHGMTYRQDAARISARRILGENNELMRTKSVILLDGARDMKDRARANVSTTSHHGLTLLSLGTARTASARSRVRDEGTTFPA